MVGAKVSLYLDFSGGMSAVVAGVDSNTKTIASRGSRFLWFLPPFVSMTGYPSVSSANIYPGDSRLKVFTKLLIK